MESLWQAFNWLDLVLILALLAALLVGIEMGFYRQLIVLCSLIVGIVFAGQLSQRLATNDAFDAIHAEFGSAGAECAAFVLIVLTPLLLALLSLLLFRKRLDKASQTLDSLLGGVVGVGVGVLGFVLVVLATFHWEDTWLHRPLRSSALASRLAEGSRVASLVFPAEQRRRVESCLQERSSIVADSPHGSEPVAPKPPMEPR